MKNIGIISYGCGNINSFCNAFNILNIPYTVVEESSQLDDISHIILPGVGSFDDVVFRLRSTNLIPKIEHYVHNIQIPFLGVCSGMQVLFESSEEGNMSGLGWLKGKVKHFSSASLNTIYLKSPHIGWNKAFSLDTNFFSTVNDHEFYFLHSYFCNPLDSFESSMNTNYGFDFISAVQKINIYATQFHPEKSHKSGLNLLLKFTEID